ncbi:hypothetical protein I550_5036 [Mycobacterium intracellulare 1956]|uniref:Uncharacterized protein n=1 Tax=Mycobacterium intracellulare 1956 TaxID=1299331 RepID=X8CDQ4_MYCIT|nr:hypothetical protein I548_1964 [Mycobacterium intracellulare]EUA53400.1 hypothetical protein I550_5036 [Mycobacterium intracellulare 1956]
MVETAGGHTKRLSAQEEIPGRWVGEYRLCREDYDQFQTDMSPGG